MRTVTNTDSNSGCKHYAYAYGDSNGNCYSNSNTDAHTYADAKGYADAQTSADSAPARLVATLTCPP